MSPKINRNLKGNLQNAKHSVRDNLQAARADVLAARKCENINDPIDTYIVDYVAMVFSKLCIVLHIIPNVVTMFSGLSGVAGGVLLALDRSLGLDILGAVLVFLSAVFDASDGQVARLTKHYSRIGRMQDGLSDSSVYISLYAACIIRLWGRSPLGNATVWHIGLIVLGIATYWFYVAQCQLPDYFKHLHMYMIDNSKGIELSRAALIRAELSAAKGFARVPLFGYWLYTRAQEYRAPHTQKLLDAIERRGKNEALCDAFYAKSRRLVKLTNLLTFNLRTIVLLACMLLHWELIGLLFGLFVLEPIRLILLQRYEKLSRDLFSMV